MNILIPWLMTFLVCVVLFLVGLRLQRDEKNKRLEQRKITLVWTSKPASATTMLRPTSQAAPSAPGIHGLEGQGEQRLVN